MTDQHQSATRRLVGSERFQQATTKVFQPFHGAVKRWHAGLASRLSNWLEGEMYVEYERARNQYIMAGPHSDPRPDQFQIGHTAGKLAAVLGFIPVLIVFVAFQVATILLPFVPVQWVASIVLVVLSFAFALALLAAVTNWMTLGVEYQVVEDETSEVTA